MNAPHDYRPALRSQDLPPINSSRAPSKPKILQALVMVPGHGFMEIKHAGRGHELAFIESGSISRWYFKRGASSPELFADLITAADRRGRRWRIVAPISAEIVAEG